MCLGSKALYLSFKARESKTEVTIFRSSRKY